MKGVSKVPAMVGQLQKYGKVDSVKVKVKIKSDGSEKTKIKAKSK